MTDNEFREVHQQLLNMLSDFQLGWIADDVNLVLNAGYLIGETDDSLALVSSQNLKGVVTTREYTPKEALLLLIGAIEAVVVHTAYIEREVTNFFRNEGQDLGIEPDILFANTDQDSLPTTFSHRTAIDRLNQVQNLQQLIQQLRLEVR